VTGGLISPRHNIRSCGQRNSADTVKQAIRCASSHAALIGHAALSEMDDIRSVSIVDFMIFSSESITHNAIRCHDQPHQQDRTERSTTLQFARKLQHVQRQHRDTLANWLN
jgi:hypothetical protein